MSAPAATRTGTAAPTTGPRRWVRRSWTLHAGPCTFVVRPYFAVLGVGLTALTLVVFIAGLGASDFPLSMVDVGRILLGGGTRVENVVVLDVGLPRALIAVLVGAGLGLSGALTQTIARNPLATPDILGITSGAAAAAVLALALGQTRWGAWLAGLGVPMAALLGGAVGAVLMYTLAWRRGIDAFRLVLVGVALTWVFQAIVAFGLTRARIDDVARAQRWLVGSVSQATWSSVTWVAVTVGVGVMVVVMTHRGLTAMGLGEDFARGLGVRTGRVTVVSLGTAVVVSAITVSAAGPISFVALLAPQIGGRLAATSHPPPLLSGLIGAVLVAGADLLVRTVLPGGLAVGVVTAAIGGPFLIYLMIVVSRRTSA